MITRRSVVKGFLSAGIGIPTAGVLASCATGQQLPGQAFVGTQKPLVVPDILTGEMRNGVRSFDLGLQRGVSNFFDGVDTPTLGINGAYLGPTLRIRVGETVQMNVANNIGQSSTLHWHGFHLPARADGGPHQVIRQGQTWSPQFTVKQRASMFWYHSHMVPRTGPQVYQGLAGLIYVEDERSGNLGLAQEYGIDDVPIVLQDRRFGSDGRFEYGTLMHDRMLGMKGDTLLVNGTVNPHFVAKTDTLRLRFLNGSNSRMYKLGFSDRRSFYQISSDGGLLASPVEMISITLGPAERADIIVDLSDGRPVMLKSSTPSFGGMMGGGMMGGGMMGGGQTNFDVLDIRPDEGRKRAIVQSGTLENLEFPDPTIAVKTRKFTLGMGMMMGGGEMTINGRSMDMNRVDETVRIGTKEVWIIENPTMIPHPFHIHDVQFRILDRNGSPPLPGETGLKDTVVVPPRERVRLLLQFADYADPDRPYMYHCHNLEHEDAGMMGQFTVVS